jgi:EAL domain-containing protein (putative c-di-GMP-specific phosphodiesterase class I)
MKGHGGGENASSESDLPLETIIRRGGIVTHFQPIISIKKKEVVGFEGLSRGVVEGSDRLIPPNSLYSTARKGGCVLALDRLCRKKTLENFKKSIYNQDDRQLVFMNFEASLLDEGVGGSGHMMKLVSQLDIHPCNIVIEIIESKVKDVIALKNFVETYRYYGFIIALDDVGSGHSNFDRISLIKPDVLKINRDILKNIDSNYYKQEVFKSIVNLSHNIGTVVVAEGVETEQEVLQCLTLGADLFQGYYFAKPHEAYSAIQKDALAKKVAGTADSYKADEIRKIRESNERHSFYARIIKGIITGLYFETAVSCEDVLREIVLEIFCVEAIYIVDHEGVQVTDTIINVNSPLKRHKLFQPAQKKDDHSLKEYIYPLLHTGLKRFTTDRYISLATGNVCRTVSAIFADKRKIKYILCVDFREDG